MKTLNKPVDDCTSAELISALKQQHRQSKPDTQRLLVEYRDLKRFYEQQLNHGDATGNQDDRRMTLMAEAKALTAKPSCRSGLTPLPALLKPDLTQAVGNLRYLAGPTAEQIARFQAALRVVHRFDTPVRLLDKAVLLPDFLAPPAQSSLLNAFIQAGGVLTGDSLDIEALMDVWEGQALSFRVNKGIMIPQQDSAPAEVVFYKLENRHQVFKRLAEEFAQCLRVMYACDQDESDIHHVTLSLRYLVPGRGGNPVHVDAFQDTTVADGQLYTNQQFSVFLSAPAEETFIVFNSDGSQTVQQGNGSLLAFNPTLRHHHPDGRGSWILIIEALKKQPWV